MISAGYQADYSKKRSQHGLQLQRRHSMHNIPHTRLVQMLAAAGLLSTGGALAQNTDASPETPKASKGIAEVVVTAQKIAQPAIRTPVALSVLGGDDLREAGITDALALGERVPNIQLGQSSGKLQIAIRGVASFDTTEKGDPSAAFNIDGAYISRPEAQTGAFFDLERVEVLRGPQGTLYGRNATAGAINVITAKPGKNLEGRVGVEVGNYGSKRVDGMLNIPVNEVLALRAAVTANRRDTYLHPGQNTDTALESRDNKAGRIHALASFTKDTSLLLTAETVKTGGIGSTPVPLSNFFDGTPIDRLPFSPPGTGNNIKDPVYVDRGSEVQQTLTGRLRPGAANRDNKADALRGEFKTVIGPVGLTYQVAHLKTDIDEVSNGTYFGFPFNSDRAGGARSTSNEIRFNSVTAGPLRWVAGLYSFHEGLDNSANFRTYITLPNGATPVTVVPYLQRVDNRSRAAFGQLTWSVRNDTRVIVGLRRTKDDKSGSDPLAGAAAPAGSTRSSAAYSTAVSFSDTSWKLGVDHDLSRSVMLYASAATGYKAGGFNDQVSAGAYAPEHLKAYEAGVKGRFMENMLQVTASVFHYDYRDQQLSAVVCPTADPISCGTRTTNAANSKVDGAELEATLRVGENGTLNGNLALTRAAFRNYKPNATADWSGQLLDRAPERGAGLGYTHVFPLDGAGELSTTVSTRYTGAYFISDPSSAVRYRQPSYHKSDLAVGYTTSNGKLTLQAFAKNLEDQITLESRVPGAFFIGDPRTFGVRASYTF
jgi:iron complex outermembrane receptor protein